MAITLNGGATAAAGTVTETGTQTLSNKTLTAPKFADLGYIADANGNELVILDTVASAVNEITLANAATAGTPTITASGGDTNVSLNLVPKGSGTVQIGGVAAVTTSGSQTLTNKTLTSPTENYPTIKTPQEITTVSATAATGTINFDTQTQAVLYYTSNASANWTVNFRGDGSTTLNSLMDNGDSLTAVFLVTQGATAYYNSAVTIDGSSVTPKWQGGTAPTAGNASSIDAYSYTIVKTASATFTVFASQTKFA